MAAVLVDPLTALLRRSPAAARLAALALAGALCVLVLALFRLALLSLEERAGALGWTLVPDAAPERRVVLVVIDEASIAEIGPWPWPREEMARLVRAIDGAGARLQLHDIVYPEARPGDGALLAALEASRGAVLAQIPVLAGRSADAADAGLMTHPVGGAACDGSTPAARATGHVAPAAAFASVPKGHIGAAIDADGAIRKTPALVCRDGTAYPALALTAFMRGGDRGVTVRSGAFPFGPGAVLGLDGYPGIDVPLDGEGNIRISFARSPGAFQAVPAADLMGGRTEPGLLENTWVLVGGTAFGMGDIVPTPYSGAAFGVELQARLLASLLDEEVPYTPRGASLLLLLLCLAFAGGLYALAAAGERAAAWGLPAAAVLLPAGALLLHLTLLGRAEVWLGWTPPAVYGALAAGALLLLELARVRLERARVFGNLNVYLPPEVARDIAFSLPSSRVNARRRDVTLLNADLRNFSAFGEARPPEEIAAVLHYFFTRATDIIERHGGRVQEFRGDGLLAMWDGNDADAARGALAAARTLNAALDDTLLPEYAIEGLEPLALGVGIEQGPALVGSIGPAHRRSHTLLGDTVVITLRIQELTAELAQPILIGECAARQLHGEKLRSQGSFLLSGLTIPHTLFAPSPARGESGHRPDLAVVAGGRR